MKISSKSLTAFILAAIICLGLWYKFGYSRFLFVDLSVDKNRALATAQSYLASLGVKTNDYRKAIVFNEDGWADRYLQKTLGADKEQVFLKQSGYELFYWRIRLFKELKKEEYSITISPSTGKVLSFSHVIEDIEKREDLNKDSARKLAEEFFKTQYQIDLREYNLHGEDRKKYDSRTDYSFSWEKKGVYIPWNNGEGGAKLLIGATISGKEVRAFYTNRMDIPEKFKRYIENRLSFGQYLSSFTFILIAISVIWSIFLVVKLKHTFIIKISKKLYIYLAAFVVIINLSSVLNVFQRLLISYSTTVSMASFLWLLFMGSFLSVGFSSIVFIFPGLAGEFLRNEQFPNDRYSSLSHYIKSTFFSRNTAVSILFGYLVFFILLGLQSVIFYFGQEYAGVWKELTSLTQFSSAYVPFFSAFVIGVNASLNEEIIFRLFGISIAKKYLKNTILAVISASLVWGFGHTSYAIFPVWFRGIEVSLMGLIFGFVFLKYGIIPVLVAHYLFDVFWGVATYLLGHSSAYLFWSSAAVLMMPLFFAAAAYFINRPEKEKKITMMLDDIQKYNLNVVTAFVSARKSEGLDSDAIKKELIAHNWDPEIVLLAIEQVFKA